MNVVKTSNIQTIHASGIELMRKVPLYSLPSTRLQTLASCSGNASPIRIHRRLFSRFALPLPCATFRLGNIAAQFPFRQRPHHFITL